MAGQAWALGSVPLERRQQRVPWLVFRSGATRDAADVPERLRAMAMPVVAEALAANFAQMLACPSPEVSAEGAAS